MISSAKPVTNLMKCNKLGVVVKGLTERSENRLAKAFKSFIAVEFASTTNWQERASSRFNLTTISGGAMLRRSPKRLPLVIWNRKHHYRRKLKPLQQLVEKASVQDKCTARVERSCRKIKQEAQHQLLKDTTDNIDEILTVQDFR